MKAAFLRWGWLVLVIACTRSNDPVPNKNTNWLNACVSTEDCGVDQTCLCGLCTAVCSTTGECDRDGVPASCVPVSDRRIEAQCGTTEQRDAVSICVAKTALPAMDAEVRDAASSEAGPLTEVPDARIEDATDGGASSECAPCAEGWSCIDGVCVQILAEEQPGIMAFARDAERLYWVNYGTFDPLGNYQQDGSIMAMPLGGGEIVTLAEGRDRPTALAIDDAYAYWVEITNEYEEPWMVMRVALSGGTPELVTRALITGDADIAVDATYVYFLGRSETAALWLKRTLKDGSGEPEALISPASVVNAYLRELAVVGNRLYWTGQFSSFYAARKDGSGDVSLFGTDSPASFVVEQDAVYYTDLFQQRLYVRALPLGSDEELRLANVDGSATREGEVPGVAVDADHVYWTWTRWDGDTPTEGVLAKTDKSPGATDILWTSELLVRALVVTDDAYVYLGRRGVFPSSEGIVLRIAKDGEGTP